MVTLVLRQIFASITSDEEIATCQASRYLPTSHGVLILFYYTFIHKNI